MVSVERVRDQLWSMFWLVPAACVAVAVGAAVGLVTLDQALGPVSTGVLFPGPPSGARSFLSSITQAMIAFTALVFRRISKPAWQRSPTVPKQTARR
jgi:uncharacterized membrane protein